MSLKTLGMFLLIVFFAFGCYRIGYNKAETEGELALQTLRLEQAQAIIDAQNEVKNVYEQKMQNLIAAHDDERSAYDERLRQLAKFSDAGRDLETCSRERRELAKLAVRSEGLLKRADIYLGTLVK